MKISKAAKKLSFKLSTAKIIVKKFKFNGTYSSRIKNSDIENYGMNEKINYGPNEPSMPILQTYFLNYMIGLWLI